MTDTEPPDDSINVVWEQTVDNGKFSCSVVQENKTVVENKDGKVTFDDRATTGTLSVYHVESGDLLLQENVNIVAGAIFGPDVADVAVWQQESIKVIDRWYHDHSEEIPLPKSE